MKPSGEYIDTWAVWFSLVGNYGFVLCILLYSSNIVAEGSVEKFLRQLGFSRFWRFTFVSVRYIGLALIWTDLALEATATA